MNTCETVSSDFCEILVVNLVLTYKMNMDRDASSTDEYYVTAVQIFDYCGADSSGTLRVDALMDKFAPFVKADNAEYSYLKSLLDPEHCNPEIDVEKLARTLHLYRESQKSKVDLDESFNLKTGPMPQDSDSGISTDGYQLLEELQCELREKSHLANQLRSQLDYTDRQHEEAIATLTSERDSLRAHLNLVREENAALSDVRQDYEEACERLQASEKALADSNRELDTHRRKLKHFEELVSDLEVEKLTLQELLTKSKDECHRINEMYASRQATLREQNETLKTEYADLDAKFQDQEEFMQQILKEKVLLEMELKEMLNRSNQAHRLSGSIDVSFTEDQMLTALDTLNADSRFSQDNRLLEQDAFDNALREDQGRSTNMSLFDEIRLSFCNVSRFSMFEDVQSPLKCSESLKDDETQYENCKEFDSSLNTNTHTEEFSEETDIKNTVYIDVAIQTENLDYQNELSESKLTLNASDHNSIDIGIQTENFNDRKELSGSKVFFYNNDHNSIDIGTQTESVIGGSEMSGSKLLLNTSDHNSIDIEIQTENQDVLNKSSGSLAKDLMNFIDNNFLNVEIQTDHQEIQEKETLKSVAKEMVNVGVQVDKHVIPVQESVTISLNTQETQTDDLINNNNNETCLKCIECEKLKSYTVKLESQLKHSHRNMKELQLNMEKYEGNLDSLQSMLKEENYRNNLLQSKVQSLQATLGELEGACEEQKNIIDTLNCESVCAECQTDCDVISVATQVETPCLDCDKRRVASERKGLRKFIWDPIKSLLQMFAIVSFLCAISVLYGVTRRWNTRCHRDAASAVPWNWLDAQDLMDLLLSIEYYPDIPM